MGTNDTPANGDDKPTHAFVRSLVELDIRLEDLLAEHLSWNKTLLPHVFMGDVSRQILAYSDEELRLGHPDTQELIVVSFVENLIGQEVQLRVLMPLMGTTLREQTQRICGTDLKPNMGEM
jgi:hypothetical protein